MPPSKPRRIQRNREYDPFADLYNRFWGVDYREAAWPVLRTLLLSRLNPGAGILDVCCGAGHFSQLTLTEGFAVHGLDASAQMLRHARRNAPGATFTTADVRDFNLAQEFDAAFCIFESLNHVPDLDGIEQAFVCTKQHLRPGAPFLFDLVGPATYLRNWNATHAIVEDDLVCAIRMTYDEAAATGTCKIALVDDPPAWRRTDFELRQYCHPTQGVMEALGFAGFTDITLHSRRDLNIPASLGLDRLFFLAHA